MYGKSNYTSRSVQSNSRKMWIAYSCYAAAAKVPGKWQLSKIYLSPAWHLRGTCVAPLRHNTSMSVSSVSYRYHQYHIGIISIIWVGSACIMCHLVDVKKSVSHGFVMQLTICHTVSVATQVLHCRCRHTGVINTGSRGVPCTQV